MRMSTAYTFNASISNLQKRQEEVTNAQEQMSSLKRVSKPSDDPTAAARAERALAEQGRGEQLQRSIDASKSAMGLTESAMGQAIDLMGTARESLVAAGNGAFSADERKTLANHLRELRNQLLSVANQSDGAGGYLFSGQASTKLPFIDAPGGVVAQSGIVAGEVTASDEERLPLSIDGPAIWLNANSGNGSFETGVTPKDDKANLASNTGSGWISAGSVGNPAQLTGANYEIRFSNTGSGTTYSVYEFTEDANGVRTTSATPMVDGNNMPIDGVAYKSGQAITSIPGMTLSIQGAPADGDSFDAKAAQPDLNVFDALDRAITVLEGTAPDGAVPMQAVNSGLRDLDQVLGRFQSARAMVGETLSRLDDLTSRTADRVLAAKTTRSNAEDLDMIQAASDFTNKQTSFQAALQSYSMVQKLSLFNYINN